MSDCKIEWIKQIHTQIRRAQNRLLPGKTGYRQVFDRSPLLTNLAADWDGIYFIYNYQPAVGEAKDGVEAIDLFRHIQPGITLMNLRMPEMDGVEAITAICDEFNTARIIVLTTYDSDEDIYRGLRAGAKGYLLEDCKPNEWQTAIRTVYNGQQYIPANVGAKLAERMSYPELTDRELEILQLITQGMSNLEIGAALNITENTVK